MKRKYEINLNMKSRSYKVDIPFSEEEKADFLAFIKAHGKSRGQWVRIVVLKAMAAEERALKEAAHV